MDQIVFCANNEIQNLINCLFKTQVYTNNAIMIWTTEGKYVHVFIIVAFTFLRKHWLIWIIEIHITCMSVIITITILRMIIMINFIVSYSNADYLLHKY